MGSAKSGLCRVIGIDFLRVKVGPLLRFAVERFFTPAEIKDLLELTERLAA